MDKERKTEIVDECIYQALKELNQKYQGEIHVVSDSDYSKGRIVIKVLD